MNSRDIIITAVREAVKHPSEIEIKDQGPDQAVVQYIEREIGSQPEEMATRFKDELAYVSGECYHIHDIAEAVPVIRKIMNESRYTQIAVTQEPVCTKIVDLLKVEEPSIKPVQALSIKGPERKLELETIPVALVQATYAICDTGTLVFPYDDTGTSLPHFLSECVIAVVFSDALVPSQFHLFRTLPLEKAENMAFITGPSRTADIEKVLILGAHGPKRLVVLLFSVHPEMANLSNFFVGLKI